MTAASDEPSGEAAPTEQTSALALDLRRNALRPDLAAASLRGKVNAPRYAAGVVRQVIKPQVPIRRMPNATLGLETEALFGELVTVYDDTNGWAWVQLERDRYVGYVPSDTIAPETRPPTHRVKALGTFVYPVPDIKASPLMHISINSPLRITATDERFSRLDQGGFVISRHITEANRFERDPVEIAERLIGTPYLWGGRSRVGIDCSGLVQTSLEAAGIPCPRDSDMQAAEMGTEIPVPENLEGLVRGDLIFWKGHVGIMADGLMLVHANAHHMAVVVETLPEAADRIAKTGSKITSIRRLQGAAAQKTA